MKRLLLLIPFFVLAACELAVEVDVPDGGPQLSLNGLSPSDSTWRIDVFKARNILEAPFYFDSVTNATVTITDETTGTNTVLQRVYYGRYRSPEKPVPGHQYSIKVEAEGFPALTGSTVAPDLVEIIKAELDTNQTVIYNDHNGHQMATFPLTITFNDPGGVKNTYETEVYEVDSSYFDWDRDGVPELTIGPSYIVTYINDPALVDKKDQFNTDSYPHRFTDESFEGQQKTVTILVPYYVVRVGGFKMGVRLYNQGYEYAKFVDDRNLQWDTDHYPFAQPVPVYSNLSNRNGIFAVKTASKVEWPLR